MVHRKWRALLLSTGYDKGGLRRRLGEVLGSIGFDAVGYDLPSYPVEYDCHAHEACLRGVGHCDFAVAILDKRVGGALAFDDLTEPAREELFNAGILDSDAPSFRPSIVQTEIQLARYLGRPVVVLCPTAFEQQIQRALTRVRSGEVVFTPRSGSTSLDEIAPLIERRDWWALHRRFIAAGLDEFGQVAFVEQIRREQPNWVTFYPDEGDQMLTYLFSRLGDLRRYFARADRWLPHRLNRNRNPLDELSLADLVRLGGLIDPSFTVRSGAAGLELTTLSDGVARKDNYLLLGGPGAGKSTIAFTQAQRLAERFNHGLDQRDIHLIQMRDVPVVQSADELIRFAIGKANDRGSWPDCGSLSQTTPIAILDGLDEWAGTADYLGALMTDLAQSCTLVATSRGLLSDRRLRHVRNVFDVVAEVEEWDGSRVLAYSAWLRHRQYTQAAEWIESAYEERAATFLRIPLWLSMISFLLRPGSSIHALDPTWTDEHLVDACATEVRDEQCRRHSVAEGSIGTLDTELRRIAWELHQCRRLGDTAPSLESVGDESISSAIRSLLDSNSQIDGFFHEMFFEYWLAEHYVSVLKRAAIAPPDTISVLGLQRSPTTNRLIRYRVRKIGRGADIAKALISIFCDFPHDEFIENQLVYFIARFDASGAVSGFLRDVFDDNSRSIFVRLSAGFGAMHNLDRAVRDGLITYLKTDPGWAAMNGGYHLYYYGDLDHREREPAPADDGSSDAEATAQRLIARIGRTSDRASLLRPVEMLTLDQLLSRRPQRVSDETATSAEMAFARWQYDRRRS